MPELIDKCVGSKIWVVMKGDKGKDFHPSMSPSAIRLSQKQCGEVQADVRDA